MARYKKHVVRYGETIQSIAAYEMGSVAQWITIAKYNQLEYPYIVDTDSDKLKNIEHLVTIGDMIVIPVETELTRADLEEMKNQDKDEISKLALGSDLTMVDFPKYYGDKGTQDSILQLDGNNRGDLKTIYGIENVRQSIIAHLLTPKGSLLLHPEYGSNLHELFAQGNIENVLYIDDEISRTILTDGRISDVKKLSSTLSAFKYESNWSVTLEDIEEQMDFVISRDETGNFAIV